MKKIISFLAILMMSMAIPQSVKAYDFSYTYQGQTLYYNIVNGEAQVTYQYQLSSSNYSNLSGTLVIPDTVTYDGISYSVTIIGEWAFYGCSGLTSVTIGNSVTSIGYVAFFGCSGLTSVTIPNSVTSIDYMAFSGCSGLTSVTIPNSVTSIGNYAFSGCSGLNSIVVESGNTHYDSRDNCNAIIETSTITLVAGCQNTIIPNAVTSIGGGAFSGCSGLTSVTIPSSVTSIGGGAFSGCSGLTSVTIPDYVTSIGNSAFYGCSGLTSVTIPNFVTSIGNDAFSNCSGLTSVIFNAINCTTMGDLYQYDMSGNLSVYPVFQGCANLTTLTIGENVTRIPDLAFYGCSSLTSVTISNSVNFIGYGAFYGCSGLTSVTIPDSVTSIGSLAFRDCNGLTSVIFNAIYCTSSNFPYATYDNINFPVFAGCTNLRTLTIGEHVSGIYGYVFTGCSGLTEITCHRPVAPTLGNSVFNNVPSSIPIYIPCGSTASYQSGWVRFSNFIEVAPEYIIDVQSADTTMGNTSITTQFSCESPAVIETTPNEGYHFTQWNDGNTDNPRSIILTQDTSFIANFALNQYTLTVQSNNESIGSVTGSGIYHHFDTVVITATTTLEHHHFAYWSDGNRDNPRQIVITGDSTIIATFAIDTHTVSVVANEVTRGTITGSGNYAYGTACVLTAIPYEGYTFVGWSNGVLSNPYAFPVETDVELTALFVAEGEDVYTVTVESADPTMGTASGGGQALDGGTVTIRAAGNPGYHFLRWNDNNTDSIRTVEVHGNATYTAYFEADNAGLDEVDVINAKIYTIHGQIVVEGSEDNTVWLYDVNGRILAIRRDEESHRGMPLHFDVPASGTYLVKIGTHPARKVVVIR